MEDKERGRGGRVDLRFNKSRKHTNTLLRQGRSGGKTHTLYTLGAETYIQSGEWSWLLLLLLVVGVVVVVIDVAVVVVAVATQGRETTNTLHTTSEYMACHAHAHTSDCGGGGVCGGWMVMTCRWDGM